MDVTVFPLIVTILLGEAEYVKTPALGDVGGISWNCDIFVLLDGTVKLLSDGNIIVNDAVILLTV